MKAAYKNQGFYLIAHTFDEAEVNTLINQLSVFEGQMNNYGVRDLMAKVPYVRRLADSAPLSDIAKAILGENAKPVRSVFFDKVPEANWNVAWHQDTSIAVKSQHDLPGFGPWSEKQGIAHVEPPEAYLANILTLRLHLDTANRESGVLRVVPGTHRRGRVASKEIIKIVDNSQIVDCNANPGDVLLMNPLLFHSSRKAVSPSHRRVVHIEYSAMELPNPLAWYE
ncbi:phytanoyl-CoA dioxygenase family protein [Methylomonas methanica]|uniref:Phytanoyl-CoA dioxygenase n=1 Tax=Methylomonas methanica (strain DSM 25384 / MC09) TaxID=857087 RepID=F9ZZL4_METMM|nr:phytanoyl-CoA dioxygenase family protein [Methylomonas methanica]AEF98673.1 Phytanoyl-CoA dioxygenase [Methylomonas methanica MC09]